MKGLLVASEEMTTLIRFNGNLRTFDTNLRQFDIKLNWNYQKKGKILMKLAEKGKILQFFSQSQQSNY